MVILLPWERKMGKVAEAEGGCVVGDEMSSWIKRRSYSEAGDEVPSSMRKR
jgi:hypothetical protein